MMVCPPLPTGNGGHTIVTGAVTQRLRLEPDCVDDLDADRHDGGDRPGQRTDKNG
jgi:hypothetical protein